MKIASVLCPSDSKQLWPFQEPGMFLAKMLIICPFFVMVIYVVFTLLLKHLPVASLDFLKINI